MTQSANAGYRVRETSSEGDHHGPIVYRREIDQVCTEGFWY